MIIITFMLEWVFLLGLLGYSLLEQENQLIHTALLCNEMGQLK